MSRAGPRPRHVLATIYDDFASGLVKHPTSSYVVIVFVLVVLIIAILTLEILDFLLPATQHGIHMPGMQRMVVAVVIAVRMLLAIIHC